MKIHVAARNRKTGESFLKNHSSLPNVVIHEGVSSLFSLLQDIIHGDDDYALFCHDDVYFPSKINQYATELVADLDSNWPNWGVCGNAGISLPTLANGSRVCRYLSDPHGGPTLGGYIIPAETIDGNTILLNCRALRSANIQLPNFHGFQFYDICLCIETLAKGRAVLVSPQLACFHNSGGNQAEFDRASTSQALVEYLSTRLSNRYLETLNGSLHLPYKGKIAGQFDIRNAAITCAAKGRQQATVAIAIRTQFRNLEILKRAVSSARAFAAAADDARVAIHLVSEFPAPLELNHFLAGITIHVASIETGHDTRSLLVHEAVCILDSDFVLFLDDDDWLVPNEATYLSALLTCLPKTTMLVVECQYFSDNIPGDNNWRNSLPTPTRKTRAADWPENIKGNNRIPFCGAFYSLPILRSIPKKLFSHVTYFEDYAVTMFSILNDRSVIFIAPSIVSCISIRETWSDIPNVVTQSDRTSWHQSQAELTHFLCEHQKSNVLVSLGQKSWIVQADNTEEKLSWLDKKALVGARFVQGMFIFLLQPRQYRRRIKKYRSSFKNSQFKGLLRSISDTRYERRRKAR